MPMERTCGEQDEIKLTPIGVKLNGSRRGPQRQAIHRENLGPDGFDKQRYVRKLDATAKVSLAASTCVAR